MFNEQNIKIFSSRDKIRSQLVDYTKNYLELENTDLSKESYLSYYIDVMSVLTSNLVYYNTSVWREFFLTKAIQKESVVNLAATLGYSAGMAKPAFCNVLVKLPCDFDTTQVQYTFHGRKTSDEDPEPFKFNTTDVSFIPLNDVLGKRQHINMATKMSNRGAAVKNYVKNILGNPKLKMKASDYMK